MDTRIYREPPRTNVEPTRKASSLALVAFLIVVVAGLRLVDAQTWDHASLRLIAYATTFVGFGVVIAIKRIHAAWKKRHDAKLMIEWERRLEEMK